MKYTLLTLLSLTFLFTLLGSKTILAQQKGGEILNASDEPGSMNTYAVVVGISNYQNEGIPDLEFADKDALAFAGFLQSKSGGSLDNDHLKLFVNEDATLGAFAMALDWLKEVAAEGDRVIIFFSGHGDVESNSFTQPGFLLCWDAPSRVYFSGGTMGLFYFQDYISTLSLINKAKVVVIADACRAGKLSGSSVAGSQLTNANLLKQYANELKILSCQPTEYSIEGEQWGGGRGAFSYHLVNGLYGFADRNEDLKVTIMELRTYLEDNVAQEVVPYSQLPVTNGDSREVLSHVDLETLNKIKASKLGEIEMYSAIALRGQKEELLEAADASTRDIYEAFENALEDKRFLSPENDCAEFYYIKLINDPTLKPLHSGFTRNYAAALQDDAQQALNTLINTGLDKLVTEGLNAKEVYKDYPSYLDRAAELLGPDHYMYPKIKARKYYFEGRIAKEDSLRQPYFQKALKWQADMPHVYERLMWTVDIQNTDSVLLFANKAIELAPSWVRPYTSLYYYFKDDLEDEKEALKWLRKAHRMDTNSAYVNYLLGNYFEATFASDSAVYYYQKAVNNVSSEICFPCAHNQLGLNLLNQGKLKQAEEHFLFALYDPRSELNSAIILTNLAVVNYLLGKTEKSMDYITQSLEVDSTIQKTYYLKGMVYSQQKEMDLAELNLMKAYKLDSSDKRMLIDIGNFYFDWEKYDQASSWYLKALEHFPDNSVLVGNAALSLLESGNYMEAIPYYNRVLELDPDNIAHLTSLGSIYANTGQSVEAYQLLKRRFELDSSEAESYFLLASATSNVGNHEEGLRLISKGLALDSSQAMYVTNAGVIHWNLGNFKEAEKYLVRAIKLDSSYLSSYEALAGVCLQTGQVDRTIEIVELMGKHGANALWVKSQTANILTSVGRYEEVEQILTDVIKQYPTADWAYNQLGVLYQTQKKFDLAEESFRNAIRIDPSQVDYYRNLGRVYVHSNKYEEGLKMYHKVIELQPENPNFYNNLGDLYFVMGRYEEAEEYLKIGRQIGASNLVVHITSAQVQQALQNWEEALIFIETAINIRQDIPSAFILQAISYAHLEQNEAAEQAIKKAQELEINGTEDLLKYARYLAVRNKLNEAWIQLEECFKTANGKMYLQTLANREADFEKMRSQEKWSELMQTYFPGS